MKKKVLLLASIVAMTLASCSNDDAANAPDREGEVDVAMTMSLPQALQTYAVSSDKSGLANLEGESDLYVRYIMEVYLDNSTNRVDRKIVYKPLAANGDYKSATISTRLVAAKYKFVFWADIVKKYSSLPPTNTPLAGGTDAATAGVTTPFYGNRYFLSNETNQDEVLVRAVATDTYSAGDLQTISSKVPGNEMFQPTSGEMYDGYTSNNTLDLRSEAGTQSIVLKRPFAKVRVITTDANVIASQNIDLSTISMGFTYSGGVPDTYDAVTGTSSGSESNFTAMCSGNATYSDEDTNDAVKTLGVMYLLPPEQTNDMTLTFSVKDGGSVASPYSGAKVEVGAVPLATNKLTTIKGNLLSKNAMASITIDDEFETTGNDVTLSEASSEDDLKAGLTGSTQTVTYTGLITKAAGLELNFDNMTRSAPLYADGNDAVLTLNLTNIEEDAVLTFRGTTNGPKTIVINNSKRCSVRMNMKQDTYVNWGGTEYKYLVHNCIAPGTLPNVDIEAQFVTRYGTSTLPTDDESKLENFDLHIFDAIEADFSYDENKCFWHNDLIGTECTLEATLKAYFEQNPNKTIWDFVGDSNN